ncbi:359_t:CDS:1, partial [Dentiscutata heterogama]
SLIINRKQFALRDYSQYITIMDPDSSIITDPDVSIVIDSENTDYYDYNENEMYDALTSS